MAKCEATFDPSKWRNKFGIKPVTEDKKDCTRDRMSESKYCKYHSDSAHRKKNGIKDVNVFIDILKEDRKVFAPVFQSLIINNIKISNGKSTDIGIIHPRIENKLEIKDCDFKNDFRIINGRIGNAEIRHPESEYEIEFRESIITGDLHIGGDEIDSKIVINKTDVHGSTEISAEFSEEFHVKESRFGEILFINDCVFKNGLDLSDSIFWGSLLVESSKIERKFRLHPITTEYLIYISGCNIDQLDLSLDGMSNNLVRVYYSELQGGTLRQQKQGETYIDLSYSSLGDIDIIMQQDDLKTLHIHDCEYTDFDFTQLRNQLKESSWHLHHFGLDWEEANSEIRRTLSTPIARVPYRTYVDQFHTRNYVETYIKAKERASRQGDSRTASEFLINEMRSKRKKRAHNLSTSDFSLFQRITHNIAQLRNVFLDYSCGFGEKPWKAAGWAVGIPLLFGVLVFPLVGGIKSTETGQQFAFYLDGQFDIFLGIEVIAKNLYFSILSFSTIGSNLYSPGTLWSHILVAIESLLGPFIVALFVFTLGKQVTR